MTVTDELDQWVMEHGSERDALNVALARLHLAEANEDRLRADVSYWQTDSSMWHDRWNVKMDEIAEQKNEVDRMRAENDRLRHMDYYTYLRVLAGDNGPAA